MQMMHAFVIRHDTISDLSSKF